MMPPFFPRERKLRIAAAIAIVAGLGIFALLPPPSGTSFGFPACVFHKSTGLPCPFCGGTRAASALLHGDLGRSIYLNPLAIPAVALLLTIAAVLGWEGIRGKPLADWGAWTMRYKRFFLLALLGAFLWWLPHVYIALRMPKPELLDLSNPIARTLYERIHPRSP